MSARRTRYAALICDLDGTLLDSNSVAPYCLNLTLSHHGLAHREIHTLRRFASLPPEQIWNDLLPSELEHLRVDCCAFYRAAYRETLVSTPPLYIGALAVLSLLREAGLTVAILSNRNDEETRLLTRAAGIAELASAVVGVSEVRHAKPSTTALDTTLAPLFEGVPRDRILMCGDSSVDLLFARNASIPSCWAKYGYGDSQQCEGMNPDHILERVQELPELVLGS